MKKILTAMAAAAFVVYSSLSFASYAIHLKDGREFVTDRYWEEGDQIKFKRYGGTIGIQKDLVEKIEKIEDFNEEKDAAGKQETPEATKKTGVSKQGRLKGTKKAEGTGEIAEIAEPKPQKETLTAKSEEEKKSFLKEKGLILTEIQAARVAFMDAKAKNDRVKKDQYWNKLLWLQKKLAGLRERVMAGHSGKLPSWWESVR